MEWECRNVFFFFCYEESFQDRATSCIHPCIRRGWDGFAHHVRYEVGYGSKVLFWRDVWCGELPLKILFLELFTIACGKDAWVKENM
jgi:hypothetical protein